MTEYEVEWRETHRTKVNADNEDDARAYVHRMDRESSKTFAGVVDNTQVSKMHRVSWLEHHECEVMAMSETEAYKKAAYRASEHDTDVDCDNYECVEVD